MWNFADPATQGVWKSMAKAWLYDLRVRYNGKVLVMCAPQKIVSSVIHVPFHIPFHSAFRLLHYAHFRGCYRQLID